MWTVTTQKMEPQMNHNISRDIPSHSKEMHTKATVASYCISQT